MEDAEHVQKDCVCAHLKGCGPLRTTNFDAELPFSQRSIDHVEE